MGAPKHEKGGEPEYQRARRRSLVKRGLCGYCRRKLGRFKWLCDDCAEEHRERQRLKAWCERQDRLTGIVASWTAPFPVKAAIGDEHEQRRATAEPDGDDLPA